ncbi:MAG: hypothetical protein EA001_07105 [Oscillatoriales cyanobacterium]|nr:MAG: hypothetical protein EA001_07105 [Oscillatoriales cyanobacterium]
MEKRFLPLEPEEVISANHKHNIAVRHNTCTVSEFILGLSRYLKAYSDSSRDVPFYWDDNRQQWFTDEGVEGHALRYGEKGWQSGRLRLSIEFYPDEPEPEPEAAELPLLEASIEPADSPLDEIRRLAEES